MQMFDIIAVSKDIINKGKAGLEPMKILSRRFKEYNNGKFCGWYVESFGFRRHCGNLVIEQWTNNLKGTYSRHLSTRVYDDTEEGRTKANEVYKRLRANGYEPVNN